MVWKVFVFQSLTVDVKTRYKLSHSLLLVELSYNGDRGKKNTQVKIAILKGHLRYCIAALVYWEENGLLVQALDWGSGDPW